MSKRDTHIRINKGLKAEFDTFYGDKIMRKEMTYNDVIRMSWEIYKKVKVSDYRIKKANQRVYGKWMYNYATKKK